MTNTRNLGTIETANPVLAVAPLKEDAEMHRATDKITALYCRLSQEDERGREQLHPEPKGYPAPIRKGASLPEPNILCGRWIQRHQLRPPRLSGYAG